MNATSTVFADAARDVCDHTIGHEEFIRRAEPWVQRQARGMEVRYGRVPPWLGRQDLEQELRVQLHEHATRFDAHRARTTSPAKYISFAARKAVMKRVQRAQGLEQHRRSGPPRFELAGGGTNDLDLLFTNGAAVDGIDHASDTHAEVERAEQYAVLRGLCDTREERECVRALEREGDADLAARSLWTDREARFRLRLENEEHARRCVRVTMRRLEKDYGTKEAAR